MVFYFDSTTVNDKRLFLNEKIRYAVDQSIKVVITDVKGYILYVNENGCEMNGYQPKELIYKHTRLFNADFHPKEFFTEMWEAILAGKVWSGDVKNKRKDGQLFWVHMNIIPLLDEQGNPYQFIALREDITERKELEIEYSKKTYQLSYYDYLTGLANRRHFEEQLHHALQKAKSTNRRMAIMYLDLDGFKNINDTLGHEMGDFLLQKASQRLKDTFGKKAFIGRLGGDEFALIIPNMYNLKYLHKLASTMIRAFSRPFIVGDFELFVSASVGISIYPLAGMDMKTLLKNADVAMFQAKKEGKNNFQIYHPAMDENGYKKFLIKNDLIKAINENQFFVVYQPRVRPFSYEIIGVEALIRWNHPKFGHVSPLEFIPYAEETGLIIPLGTWILTNVCSHIRAWQVQGLPPVKASVNISAIQLLQPNFVGTMKAILTETEIDPKWLELEITENVFLNKEEQAIKTLEKLNEMGISIALDDFGTGYSALNYLIKYKFDVIKIDRSILKDIPNDRESYEIANAIVKLAQKLNKTVVAEGIETPSQLALVEKMGCNEFQGFICSQPVKETEMKQFLLDGKWCAPIEDFGNLFQNGADI